MGKHLLERSNTKRFMLDSKYWGPEKGDLLISDGKEIVVDNCYLSVVESSKLMDYVVKGHYDGQYVKIRIPVEELNNNGWSWVREKFPFNIEFEIIPGTYHVVDPFSQTSVDVMAKNPSVATAKALSFFINNPQVDYETSPFFHVHDMYKVKITPSALKMVSNLNRSITLGKMCSGPLAECFNHPTNRESLPDFTRFELNRLQRKVENAFFEFYKNIEWVSIGEAKSYSTEDFEIHEMVASVDGNIPLYD